MIEDDADSCPDGEICASIASQFATRFTDDGYVISIGAAMVCKVLGESFMRGVIKQSIGLVANIWGFWSRAYHRVGPWSV